MIAEAMDITPENDWIVRMKRMFVCFLLAEGLLCLRLAAQSAYERENIPWREDRKLTWNDFLAPPDTGSAFHALSSTGIAFSSTAKIHGKQVFVDFEVQCFFDPYESWVIAGNYSPSLLAHEQLHFDIAEVFARKLLKRLAGIEYRVEDYREQMDAEFESVLAEMEEIHNRYDRETAHGLNEAVQQKWALMVQKKLAAR